MNVDSQLAKLETLAIVVLSSVAALALIKVIEELDGKRDQIKRFPDIAQWFKGSEAAFDPLPTGGGNHEGAGVSVRRNATLTGLGIRSWESVVDKEASREIGEPQASVAKGVEQTSSHRVMHWSDFNHLEVNWEAFSRD